MSSDLKRAHSDASKDGSTKKSRSVEPKVNLKPEEHPEATVTVTLPVNPKPLARPEPARTGALIPKNDREGGLATCVRHMFAHMLALVVMAAWERPYIGSPDVLENVLRSYTVSIIGENRYACYAALTQASGTGKSRMVDELSKKILCLPVNLGSPAGPTNMLLVVFKSSHSFSISVSARGRPGSGTV